MSAWGRLWRRAPAWRFCLFGAVGMTALAAMFPPTPPDWLARWHPWQRTASADPAPRFVAQPDAPPPAYATFEMPAFGHMRSGIIPFAGRQLPLPAGQWQELAIARNRGRLMETISLLARIEDGRMTGLVIATAPESPGIIAGVTETPKLCLEAGTLAHHLTPSTPDRPLSHECWTIVDEDMTTGAWAPGQNSLEAHALQRLGLLRTSVANHMLAWRYFISGDGGFMQTMILVPDQRATEPGQVTRLQDWGERFATKLSKGFNGTLTAADGREPK